VKSVVQIHSPRPLTSVIFIFVYNIFNHFSLYIVGSIEQGFGKGFGFVPEKALKLSLESLLT
jgi:hypothetical protein